MLSRAQISLIQGLKRRKIREKEGLFLAEGVRVVEDLAASGLDLRLAVVASSLEDTPRGAALARTLRAACTTVEVSDAELARLAATETPQGVLVLARAPEWTLDDRVIEGDATVLVLDGVQDPGNFGTMLRTADALGAAFVACLPGTVDPWNPKAVRAAAGSSFRQPAVQIDPEPLAEWLRARGFALLGADAAGEPVEAAPLPPRSALVVGNEGTGLAPRTRAVLDRLVSVPIRGDAESLNVAIAAAILLYVLTRSVRC